MIINISLKDLFYVYLHTFCQLNLHHHKVQASSARFGVFLRLLKWMSVVNGNFHLRRSKWPQSWKFAKGDKSGMTQMGARCSAAIEREKFTQKYLLGLLRSLTFLVTVTIKQPETVCVTMVAYVLMFANGSSNGVLISSEAYTSEMR